MRRHRSGGTGQARGQCKGPGPGLKGNKSEVAGQMVGQISMAHRPDIRFQ